MSEPTPPSNELQLRPADPPQLPVQVCQKCGAKNPPHADRCWLCDGAGRTSPYSPANLEPLSPSRDGRSGKRAGSARVQGVFSILLGAALLLTIIIGVGLAVQDTGLTVPYMFIVGPALMATGIKAVTTPEGQGSAGSLLWTFFWSIAVTIVTVVLLVVAAIVLLFLWCASLGGLVHGPL